MASKRRSLADVALAVQQLIRKFGAEPFDGMLRDWGRAVGKRLEECQAFDAARRKHLQAARSRKRLSDERARPPGAGWEWETGTLDGIGPCSAWFPPELLHSKRPKREDPLPLPKDRDLTLAEKYAALAAIHALHSKGAKVAPWQEPVWEEEEYEVARAASTDDKWSIVGWVAYQGLLSCAEKTPQRDAPYLWGIVQDVTKDLERVGSSTTEGAKGSGHGGRPRKWDDLVILDGEMRSENAETRDKEVVKAYNAKYAGPIAKKQRDRATPETLREARRYRRRKA